MLAEYHERFRYILVDEYQDTNVAQYLWLRLLAQKRANVCCVGDDDQSIYGWRGAEVDNILRFERDFPGAKVIRLERNYRSTSHILAAASGLIAANKSRLGKTLWTELEGGRKVQVRGVWDGEAESRLIADEIERWRKGRRYREAAILVRASFQMRAFEERFVLLQIPYVVVGGPRFFERAEIRDAHAYLRLVQSPDDDLAFERIVNTPRRGIGDTTVQKLLQLARRAGVSAVAAARDLARSDELNPRARTALGGFLRDMDRWRSQKADPAPRPPHRDDPGGERLHRRPAPGQGPHQPDAAGEPEGTGPVHGRLREPGGLSRARLPGHGPRPGRRRRRGADHDPPLRQGPGVPPGLPARLGRGVFPSQRSMDETGEKGLEEERRLAYVGLTRAREEARISFAANRQVYGRWTSQLPSRFVDELPLASVEAASETGYYGGGPGLREGASRWEEVNYGSGYDSPGWKRAQARGYAGGPPGRTRVIEGEGRLVAISDPAAASAFAPGERVFHQKFGYGAVTSVEGNKLTVAFEKAGEKRVIDSFVERG